MRVGGGGDPNEEKKKLPTLTLFSLLTGHEQRGGELKQKEKVPFFFYFSLLTWESI